MTSAVRPQRTFWQRVSPGQLSGRSPWLVGAAFGCATLCVSLASRVAMIVLAGRVGFLQGLGPRQLLWIAPALGFDLLAALAVALPLTGLLRIAPQRVRPVALVVAYLLVLFTSLVCIVSIATYGALHSTLHLTQLLLAGGVQDLFETGVDIISRTGLAVGILVLLLSLALAPSFLAPLERLTSALREKRARFVVAALLAVLVLCSVLAPHGGAAGLEVNPVVEFVVSAVRYGMRREEPVDIDMSNAPHFDATLIKGSPKVPDALESLVTTSKLPLSNANVVLLVMESAAVNQLPLWNGKAPITPHLKELAQHALLFDNYYTASPVSMKSLFTLHCSSYPYPHPAAETYFNPSMECNSISEILKARGYRTGLFHSGRFSYTRKDEFFKYRKFDVMRDAETLVNRNKYPSVMWGADDRAAVDDAFAWLEQAPDKPFFLDLVFLAPHEPYTLLQAPTPYGTRSSLDRYKNATLFIDSQIGRIWDWLVAHGKADNTLLVIVGDHGEAFGEHPGHYTHGTRINEEVVRTPMMLVNPQLFSGARTPRIGNHVDLVPTILDVLGLPVVARHQGRSLLRGYRPHMLYFYADWYHHYLGLRDGQWKYIYDVDSETAELYDLSTDRSERNNLATVHADQVAAYRDRVQSWEHFYRELIPNYEHYVDSKGQCPGRAKCFVDDLKPVLQHGVMVRRRGMAGDRLQVGKHRTDRGMSVTPLSILRYNIHGEGFKRLRGGVGHHIQGRNANLSLKVSAEIYLDDNLIWSSGKLTADEEPHNFNLDVSGGSVLELIGYDVDGENWRDYMDWLDVRLER